jgi:hypothetical protein
MDQLEAGEIIRIIFYTHRRDHRLEVPPARMATLAIQAAGLLTRPAPAPANGLFMLGETLSQHGIGPQSLTAMLVGLQRACVERGCGEEALDIAERMASVLLGYVRSYAAQVRRDTLREEHLRDPQRLAGLPERSIQEMS